MSNLETGYFYILEWSQSIIDIREQYPLLPLEETQEIAEQCGFPHPTDPATKQPVVMTTDFLINLKRKDHEIEHARAIKPASELQSQRTLEKLEIERLYWKRREVDWGIVTEKEIPKTLIENLKWIHPFYKQGELAPLNQADITRINQFLRPKITERKLPLTDITNACDDRLGLEPGTSLSVVRHLIANRYWLINMNQPIQPSQVLQLLPDQAMEDCQRAGELA
ncbi:MAG: TnsA endonuclease N-terminal domain-containing protein [Tildeniella torsiva UHER 1998/13D]|jgi:hypothetical protein|nr:TnsA endonuclease N-terminal domain-containing protein [Tildeniella torsiva UHER 1998/13D]